jgi:hypothetical protein
MQGSGANKLEQVVILQRERERPCIKSRLKFKGKASRQQEW